MSIKKGQITIGKYLLDTLKKHGIEHIFGVPGDYALAIDKQIEQHSIKFINATRESTAGYMADSYARIRGLGVACITYGVGINIVNALAQAYVESSPLIVISGAASTNDIQKGIRLHHLIHQPLKQADKTQLEIFKNVTIAQTILTNSSTAAEQIDVIIAKCIETKKPIYIEIPCDQVNTPIVNLKNNASYFFKKDNQDQLAKALKILLNVLKESQRPFIWAGHEIQRYGLSSQLLAFAEKYNIPIATSLLGKAIIDENHPLSLGVYQGQMSRPEIIDFIDKCDCVIMLGLMLTDVETGIFTAKLDHKHRILANAKIIEIDSISYENIKFENLITKLVDTKGKKTFQNTFSKTKKSKFIPKVKTKITTKRVFECLQKHIKSNHIVFAEIGDSLFGSADLILPKNGFLACAHFGSLGFATPGCLGAQIADPSKRLIGLVGDGAFQMTGTELSTAVRYHLDPIIIIMNNHGYGTERPLLEGVYNNIQNWNYSLLPQVLGGGQGIKVDTEEELDAALRKALERRGEFYIIEVNLEKLDFSPALQRLGKLASQG
jgi:TPP-dependent 2-oxoacid decarboxylase